MNGFTNVFGGQNINPADLSYRGITLTVNLVLVWPMWAKAGDEVVADKMDVLADIPGLHITMPNAELVTAGQDFYVRNTGSVSFDIRKSDGSALGTVAPGEAWFFYLRDNTTEPGLWGSIQMGAGTSSADAASLAGNGLEAISTTLNLDWPVSTKNATYTVDVNDRASTLVNTGGTITFDLTTAATLGNGWLFFAVNEGSGSLTLDPSGAETIDGAATKVLGTGESCIVVCDGANFVTIGYGRSLSSTVSAISKSIAGPVGTTILSASEVAAQVQNFTGALTGNRILEYGTAPGYWFVFNNTSGAFTVTVRVNNADPGVAIAQGSYSIIRSDGTTMSIAFTATSGTVTSVGTGTGLTGGPITSTGTISLANTAVAAGSYGTASGAPLVNFTVDAQGRLTAASGTNTSLQNIVVQAAGAAVVLNSTSGDSLIYHQQSGVARFITGFSPGGNYYYINRYNDAGVYQGTPQTWNRANNDSNFAGAIGVAGNMAAGSISTTGNISVSGTSTLSGQVSTFANELLISNPSFARVRTQNSARAWTAGVSTINSFDINDETGVQVRLRLGAGASESQFLGGNGILRGPGIFYPSSDNNWALSTDGNNMFFTQNANCYNYYTRSSGNWGWVVNSSTIAELNFANGLGFRSNSNIKASVWSNHTSVIGAYNVSGVNTVGTGDYRVVFTNALPTTGYSVLSGCEHGSQALIVGYAQGGVHDQFQVAIQVRNYANNLQNNEFSVLIHSVGL